MTTTAKLALSLGEPKITVEKAEALHGAWVASGKVAYAVNGARATNKVLEFSFKDAGSQQEAIEQSLAEIQGLIDALSMAVARFQAGGNHHDAATRIEVKETAAA
jgi:hypothetical protein